MSEDINKTPIDKQVTKRRGRLLASLAIVVALSAAGATGYWMLYASRYVSTDNAYTAVEIAQVTPAVAGTISEIRVIDTQAVHKGDVLATIDSTDARLALDQAEADLGRAIRRVKSLEANDVGFGAQVVARTEEQRRQVAQVAAAQADFDRAEVDLHRRQALVASGAVSGDELTRAQNAYGLADANLKAAQAAVAQARAGQETAAANRQANAALISGSSTSDNPEVVFARARRDQAAVDVERTVIRSPVDGVIARRQVQIGQRVQAGAQLMSVVPVQEMHVDANFKEGQLEKVMLGQPVTLKSDIYGDSVVYSGVVEGFSGGTGAAFSAIPAQNATGNWIKVVQRVPVRIRLDPTELQTHPLKVGLSMVADIDTRN